MRSDKISYAGIGGAVGGIVAVLGVYANWWESDTATFKGTADVSGGLALAMAIATFAFGGAYVLMADPKIRRALGALMTICAVVLTLACVWGLTRGDQVAANVDVKLGLWISVLGGVIGIAAGIMALRDSMATDAAGASAPMSSSSAPMSTPPPMSSSSAPMSTPPPMSSDEPTSSGAPMDMPGEPDPSAPSDTSS
jgi:hypothetical protein